MEQVQARSPRYKAVCLIVGCYGVKDTTLDEYVTAWIDKGSARTLARKLNDKYGQDDYREVEGTDDVEEIRSILDTI